VTRRGRLLYLIPALWTSLFDIALTIFHQPPEYWQGNLSVANEGNPVGAFFMASHWSGLFIISVIWIFIIILLGYILPRPLAKIFLLFCVIAHSYGAATWLTNFYGFWFAIVFFLFNSVFYWAIDHVVFLKYRER
jgi:hypothetical protein